MFKQMAYAAALAALTVPAGAMLAGVPAMAQDQGARAGNSYLPSTHTKGCSGFLCDADDPRRAPGAAPPPPCEGLICNVSPYGMGRPVTAAEAQRLQEEQSRTAATAAPPAAEPKRSARRKKAKAAKAKSAAKTVAARTADPTPAAPAEAR